MAPAHNLFGHSDWPEIAAFQRVRQSENAASVDTQVIGQFTQRHRIGGLRYGFQKEQAQVKALNRTGL